MGNSQNPLEASNASAVGNFENRTLGSTDTMQLNRRLDDFIELVIETVTGRAIVKGVSTEAPIEAAYATAIHSPGFDWAFAGQTWTDDTNPIIEVRSSAQNPSVWTLGVSTEAPLRNSPADARDYFRRDDATSSSISYNFDTLSTVTVDATTYFPMVDKTGITTESVTLRELSRTGIADSTNNLTNSDSYSYEWAKFKQPIMGPYSATLVAGSTDVILTGLNGVVFNTFGGLVINKVSGTGAFGANATVATVFVTPNNKFTTSVAHATSGTIVFTIASSDTDGVTDFNADLNGVVTATQSDGIGWELGSIGAPNPAFIQIAPAVDYIPRDNIVVPYDRSTTPLEQTNVTVYSDGLGWEFGSILSPNPPFIQTVTVGQNIILREITQSYTGESGETVSTVHSGMNWSFSGDTFNETYSQINTGQTMNHVAAHDFTLGDCSYLWIMAANNTSGDATENLFILLIKTFITKGSVESITSTGAYYGAFSDPVAYPTTIRGIDSVLVSDYYNGIIDTQSYGTINEDISFVKARIERFISYVARQTFGGRLQSFINRGWMISTTKKDITKELGDNININNPGTLYYNPYNINTDATTVSSYNGGGTYFALDTRAI
jgi:hypothetical protein